jgi:hypothetical protein
MVLWSAQPLTEIVPGIFLASKGWPARNADNIAAICEAALKKMFKSRRLTTLSACVAYYMDSLARGANFTTICELIA